MAIISARKLDNYNDPSSNEYWAWIIVSNCPKAMKITAKINKPYSWDEDINKIFQFEHNSSN